MSKQYILTVVLFMNCTVYTMQPDHSNPIRCTNKWLSQQLLAKANRVMVAPGFSYKKSIESNGISYSETSPDGEKCLIAKKFSRGSCAGEIHGVMMSLTDHTSLDMEPIDNSQIQYERLKRIYESLHCE